MNEDIVGSMEFACKVAGAKLIMVLGHSECGAIKGACAGVEMGSLTSLLNKIKPAIEAVKSNNSGEDNFVEKVVSGIYSVSTGEVNFY